MKLARALLALAMVFCARPALAQLDPWEFEVYPAQIAGRGILEIGYLNSVVAKGADAGYDGTSSGTIASNSMYRSSLEFSYGLTNKIEAAAYVKFALPDGGDFRYAGSKYRLRGTLFDQGRYPIDVGWYLELEWNRTPQFDDQHLELEFRPILQKDIGRFSIIVNPKFEKVLKGPGLHEAVEFGYVSGIYYRAMRQISPGIEFYGGIGLMNDVEPRREQQHYVFAVLQGEIPGGLEYSVGPGFGLTPGSDEILVKFNIELERFVGSLFR